jgi:hypothetical protein
MAVDPGRTHTYLLSFAEPGRPIAEGVGCNLLLSHQGNLPDPTDRQRWKQVLAALDDLNVGVIHTGDGEPWDDRRQQWDFGHRHFRNLVKIARFAGERGVNLMFDPFTIPPSLKGGALFALDSHNYARKLILPVAQFFRREKLTAFRYLGLVNEAIWGPGKEGFAAVRPMFELYRGVREVLDDAGITAGELGLLGPSNLSSWEWPIADFIAAGVDPDSLWAGYDQHLYLYHFDWMQENTSEFMTLTELTERYLKRYADYTHKRNKPMFITELGNMYCGRLFWGERDFQGPASHTSVLMDAELIVRAINEGVDGFLRWAFSVKERDGRWSLVENTPQGMQPSPHAYPMYRLLMRAIHPRARVMHGQTSAALGAFRYVFGTAVQNPDRSASVLLINDAPGKNLNVALQLPAPFKGKALHRTVCDEMRKGEPLPPIKISRSGEAELMLTPSSLTVLSTKPLTT